MKTTLLAPSKRRARFKWLGRHFESAIHQNYLLPPFSKNRQALEDLGVLRLYESLFPEWAALMAANMPNLDHEINRMMVVILEGGLKTDLAFSQMDAIKTQAWYSRLGSQSDMELHRKLCREVVEFLLEPKQSKLLYEMYLASITEAFFQGMGENMTVLNVGDSDSEKIAAYVDVARGLIWLVSSTPWQEIYLL